MAALEATYGPPSQQGFGGAVFPDGVWSPFVGFAVDGFVIRLATLEGTTIVCTLVVPD